MSYKDLFSLAGKVVLVVGAAGGLAEESCVGLAQCGATLALADIDSDGLKVLCEKLEKKQIKAWTHIVDVSDEESVKSLTKGITRDLKQLDVMIDFAGIARPTPIDEIEVSEFQKIINVNLMGSFLLTQHSLPLMLDQGSGKIILIGSVSGHIGRKYSAHYAASKGGVHSLVRTVAVEMAEKNIQVNSIAPVFTLTPLNADILADPEVKKSIISTIPMGRLGLPSDLVGTVVFLSSKASDFITGQTLFVDGGCTIS